MVGDGERLADVLLDEQHRRAAAGRAVDLEAAVLQEALEGVASDEGVADDLGKFGPAGDAVEIGLPVRWPPARSARALPPPMAVLCDGSGAPPYAESVRPVSASEPSQGYSAATA